MNNRAPVTIERHISEEERRHPEATGALSNLLYDIALAAKMISREVRRAGLADILGNTGAINIHGDEVKKLDDFAHEVIFNAVAASGTVCLMASEEEENPLCLPDGYASGNYVLLYDPLDGSSNIEANASIGTIFSVYRKLTPEGPCSLADLLRPGHEQIAAGYILYGSSTLLVYTTGNGVHGFTLDAEIGEFIRSHYQLRFPEPGKLIYSVNEGNYRRWSTAQQRLVDSLKGLDGRPSHSARYIGSLVGDMHRTLSYGGLFMYPSDSQSPDGKLRLLYEAAPLAWIVEQAGGRATNGLERILSLTPRSLHERTPLFLGTQGAMARVEEFLSPPQGESRTLPRLPLPA